MVIVVDILLLFVVLQTALRLSQWPRMWMRIAFCVVVGLVVWLCTDYAASLSKLQVEGWLYDVKVLQNIAIVCLLDALLCIFSPPWKESGDWGHFSPPWERLRVGAPAGMGLGEAFPLLIFPAAFYVLCHLLFSLTGTDFNIVGLLFAVTIVVLLPLLSQALSWLLPRRSDRSLLHLAVTIILCIACLVNAQGAAAAHISPLTSHLSPLTIMDYISKLLFGIANILLIPDILLLIIFFIRSLILLVTTYMQLAARQRDGFGPLYAKYRGLLYEREPDEAYADYLCAQMEAEAAKDVNLSRLLTKLGPVLGLIGTLISMSPALVGLSTGDISGMAYNMQVVFSATVVGLVISIVGLFTQQLKSRWHAKDVARLEYVSRNYIERHEKEA